MPKKPQKPPLRNYTSREILQMLKQDGWYIANIEGSHYQLKHPTKPGKVTVRHPTKSFPPKTLKSIFRQAGWL